MLVPTQTTVVFEVKVFLHFNWEQRLGTNTCTNNSNTFVSKTLYSRVTRPSNWACLASHPDPTGIHTCSHTCTPISTGDTAHTYISAAHTQTHTHTHTHTSVTGKYVTQYIKERIPGFCCFVKGWKQQCCWLRSPVDLLHSFGPAWVTCALSVTVAFSTCKRASLAATHLCTFVRFKESFNKRSFHTGRFVDVGVRNFDARASHLTRRPMVHVSVKI